MPSTNDSKSLENGTNAVSDSSELEKPPFRFFTLIQSKSKNVQIFRPENSSGQCPYAVAAPSKLSFLTSHKDFTLLKLEHSTEFSTDVDVKNGTVVAESSFSKESNIPYVPKANLTLTKGSSTPDSTYTLAASSIKDFSFTVNDCQLTWAFSDKPDTSLVLLQSEADKEPRLVARFSYSQHGTDASANEEVGQLDIFQLDSNTLKLDDTSAVELVLGSCQIVIAYWVRMGKHYKMVEGGRSMGTLAQDRMKWYPGATALGYNRAWMMGN